MAVTGPYSRSFKRRVLEAANISRSFQDDPFCICGYCEDGRAYAEEQFQRIMAAVTEPDTGDVEAEEAEYELLRAGGVDLDAWTAAKEAEQK